MFQTKVLQEIKTRFISSIKFSEDCVFYVIMWKNIVEPDRPQMTTYHGECDLPAGQLRNICCFSTASMVRRKHFRFALVLTLHVLFSFTQVIITLWI